VGSPVVASVCVLTVENRRPPVGSPVVSTAMAVKGLIFAPPVFRQNFTGGIFTG